MTMTMVPPFAADAHVLEQAGGEQRLQRFVDLGGIVSVAGGEGEIGADGFRLDPLGAFDTDVLDDALGVSRENRQGSRLDPARAGRYSTQGGPQAALWPTSSAPLLVSSPRAGSPPPLRLQEPNWPLFCGRFLIPAALRQRGPSGPREALCLKPATLTKISGESSHSRLQRSSASAQRRGRCGSRFLACFRSRDGP